MKDEDGDEEEDEDEEAAAASELARLLLENVGPTSHCTFRALRYPGAAGAEDRSTHWSPYDRVGVVNADP